VEKKTWWPPNPILVEMKKISTCFDTPPNSLVDSTTSLNVKTMKGYGVGARFLACNTLGVEECARASGWD